MKNYGGLKLNILLCIQITLLFITPCITYYVAVTHKQVPAFPYCTVTNTACPYPQNILFRFAMLTASSFLVIIFYVMFRWLDFQTARVGYPKKTPHWLYPLAQFSVFTYTIAIGTIDSKDTGPLHTPAAVIFFLILYLATITLTYFIKDLRNWDASTCSTQSWIFKRITCLYLSGIWLYCAIGLIFENAQNKQDKYIVILQWNEVLVNLLWLLSFREDWKKVSLCLRGPEIKDCKIEESISIQQ